MPLACCEAGYWIRMRAAKRIGVGAAMRIGVEAAKRIALVRPNGSTPCGQTDPAALTNAERGAGAPK